MSDAFRKSIVESCPLLYSGAGKHPGMYFAHGDGWLHIIRDLSYKLETIIEQGIEDGQWTKEDHPVAVQVKEKYGGLRFYMSSETEQMLALIRDAEILSEDTCETCGARPAKAREGSWIKTLCDMCDANRKRDWKVKAVKT